MIRLIKTLIHYFEPISTFMILLSVCVSYSLFIHSIGLYDWDIVFSSFLFIFITITGFFVYLGVLFLVLGWLIDLKHKRDGSEE